MDLLKAVANLSNGIYDMVEWTIKRLEAPGRDISRANALGAIAEVSIPIEAGKTGEVAVVIDKTLQHYPARGKGPEIEFKKGAKVRIIDIGSNVMSVEAYDLSSSQASAPSQQTVDVSIEDSHGSSCDH
jgi:hypothetical protein